jgi:hypothetical protein
VTATTGAGSPPSSVPSAVAQPPTQAFAQQPLPPTRPAPGEACPLCGAPLDPQQDWCLNCGAAARTRLAATPNWKAPIAAIAVIAALALGVLAAALVKLAGGSDSGAAPVTTTITTAPAAGALTTPTAATTGVPTTSTPSTPGAVAPGATTASTAPAVTAQPTGAGGIASPNTTPTVTARSGTTPKALRRLSPAQRKKAEELLSELSKKRTGR